MDKKIFLNNKKQALPYSLNALKVEKFQGIKHLHLQDLPCDAQWIFLVGENGFGKTSVLRAIAKIISERKIDDVTKKNAFEKLMEEKIYEMIDPKINYWDRSGSLQRLYRNSTVPIVGYGISRFTVNITEEADENNVKSLFDDKTVLENIELEIKDWYIENNGRFATIKQLLFTLIPTLANIEVKYDERADKKHVFYTEKTEDGNFMAVRLQDLAAGYRNIICMIGDMLIRLRRMQDKSIDRKDFKNYEGIVIIDEFDAHLHPKYQYELPKLLSDVFPKVQFIVSTHSPIPLLGAPKDSAVVLKVNRTTAEGITIERMDETIDIERLSPNALLSSDIFGYKFLFARDATPESVSPFDDYKEIEEMDNIEKLLRIKNGLQKHNIRL
jgi:predicted ATP-binding protein involved in virulence